MASHFSRKSFLVPKVPRTFGQPVDEQRILGEPQPPKEAKEESVDSMISDDEQRLRTQCRDLRLEIAHIKHTHRVETERLQQLLDRTRMESKKELQSATENMRSLEVQYVSVRQDLQNRMTLMEADRKQREVELKEDLRSVEVKHGNDIKDLVVAHHKQTQDLQKKTDLEMQRLREHSEARAHLSALQLKEDRREADARLSAVTAKYEWQIQRIRKEMKAYIGVVTAQDLKSANRSGDSLKWLSDEEIATAFYDLVRMVDSLAKLPWSEHAWASDDMFQGRLASQPAQEIKKQILQDCLWSVLYEHVFSSPFHIFAEDGHKLDIEWYEEHSDDSANKGDGYLWPQATLTTERWRYLTMSKCRTALTRPVTSITDPKARLKIGFKQNLETLQIELESTLTAVVQTDDTTSEAVRKLAKRSVSAWIDWCMQPCRILVVLHGPKLKSSEDRLKSLQTQQPPLQLGQVPDLMKCGDSNGMNLDISRCLTLQEAQTPKTVDTSWPLQTTTTIPTKLLAPP